MSQFKILVWFWTMENRGQDPPVLRKEGWKYCGSHNGEQMCPAGKTSHEGIGTDSWTGCDEELISETETGKSMSYYFLILESMTFSWCSRFIRSVTYLLLQKSVSWTPDMCQVLFYVFEMYIQEQSRQKQLTSPSVLSRVRRQTDKLLHRLLKVMSAVRKS